MKKVGIIGFALILLFCWAGKSFLVSNPFQYERLSGKYQMKEGLFDGPYVSYFANGKKRAEGQFSRNQRFGKWSVWDSAGKLLVKREYKNDFEYKTLFPEPTSKTIVPPIYSLIRNEVGLYNYFDIKQSDVVVSKRVWRNLGKDDESSFFGNDLLYHALIDSIAKGKISIYEPNSETLLAKISAEGLVKIMDTTLKEIIGFKIVEDWFFDTLRKSSEKRIIKICPIICKKDAARSIDDDFSFDLGWLNFSEIRNTLNGIKIENSNDAANIKTEDDFFFFRCFPSEIYKESNVKNMELKDYCKTVDKLTNEQIRIEIEMIEIEHDLWIRFSK